RASSRRLPLMVSHHAVPLAAGNRARVVGVMSLARSCHLLDHQTHQLEGLAVAIPWGFESPFCTSNLQRFHDGLTGQVVKPLVKSGVPISQNRGGCVFPHLSSTIRTIRA